MQCDLMLCGGRVIDPAQSLDGVMDVAITGGRVAALGALGDWQADRALDLSGRIVTPGLVDFHVHAYGSIAYRDPDTAGVLSGVTTIVDGGSAGTATFDDFLAVTRAPTVSNVYSYMHVEPSGIPHDGDRIMEFADVELGKLVEITGTHADVVRALKAISVSYRGPAYIALAKAVAKIVGLPLYVHFGDWRRPSIADIARDVFPLLEENDLVIHMYSSYPNNVLDAEGNLLPEVQEAQARGVLFDVAHGRQNFSWRVAERAIDQGLLPHLAGTDLGIPAAGLLEAGLTEVMSNLLLLGFELDEVIRLVTINPAKALRLEDQFGSLRVGMPADVTVLIEEHGEFEYLDSHNQARLGTRRVLPVLTIKDGALYEPDLSRLSAPDNARPRLSRQAPPEPCRAFSVAQRAFLGKLADEVEGRRWQPAALHRRLHELIAAEGLAIPEALEALFQSFQIRPFMPHAGWFLTALNRDMVVARLRQVASGDF